ncbi:MAG TPA: folylpolyglutamate synthase/dihydrofolate synthase family protein [Flavobacteriales bacterium]|nr:folylpolyglutamate synthase/dihydrofolate synthase family protein [Flavobacteriales bacterium]
MDYAGTLAYLHARLPMFSRIGKAAYKADLSNTHALMDLLDHPEHGLKCVHVAGTNGKGSTSHMLASILQEAGLRTGLHTSPHLKDFRERIRINGAMIPEQAVVDFVERYKEQFEPISASFFEWSVALTFDHFRAERTDIAVIETGLGGRLDSTNVVTPEISVITNIGWDHADLLGGSLEAIAGEKAGIIKPGVPVVVGEASGNIAAIFRQKVAEVGAPIHFVDQHAPLPYALDLSGPHQERNARTVVAAVRVLQQKGWAITDDHIRKGLANTMANTGFAGRWQTIGHDPLTIVDVGHNEDGLKVVREMLQRTPHKQLHIVLGTVNDKDTARMFAQLPQNATYWFCKADIPRGLDAVELRERALAAGLKGEAFPSVAAALAAARHAAAPGDLVLVTGSVFVVAEAL